jgi:hypothetical protein
VVPSSPLNAPELASSSSHQARPRRRAGWPSGYECDTGQAMVVALPLVEGIGETPAAWRDVGTIDASWEAPRELVGPRACVSSGRRLTMDLSFWTSCRRSDRTCSRSCASPSRGVSYADNLAYLPDLIALTTLAARFQKLILPSTGTRVVFGA